MASNTGKNQVTFLYDLISPWSYIALVLIKRFEKEWNLDIKLEPVALGFVFQASGNSAPLFVKNKAKMMSQDFRLSCDVNQVPMSEQAWTVTMVNSETIKPPNSMGLMKFMFALKNLLPEQHDAVAASLFDSIFGTKGGQSVFEAAASNDAEKLYEAIQNAQNVPKPSITKKQVEEILEKSNKDKEIKEKLKNDGKKFADEFKAYGVPWLRITRAKDGKTRNFMGSDKFEFIAGWLGVPYKGTHPKSKL